MREAIKRCVYLTFLSIHKVKNLRSRFCRRRTHKKKARSKFSLKQTSSQKSTALAPRRERRPTRRRLQRKYNSDHDHGVQQSDFFNKLPRELRDAVYAELLALEEPLDLKFVPHSKDTFRIRCEQASRLLAFPKTCWQAYLESIHYVYSANTFRIDHPGILSLLPLYTAPRLLASIRSLRLYFSMPLVYQEVVRVSDAQREYKPLWDQGWSVVSKLQGLKTLYVKLARSMRSYEPNQRAALQPLRKVKGLESFVIVADEHLFESAVEGIEATFIIVE